MIGPHPVRSFTPGALGLKPTTGAAVSALDLGRAMDAALRGDADFFLQAGPAATRPAVRVGAMLQRILPPIADEWDGLIRLFEAGDPVEISLGLERIVRALTAEVSNSSAASLAAHLAASLRVDPDLTDAAPGQILTYAGLEGYLLRGATPAAKRELDAFRNLITAATGHTVQAVNQDEDLGTGLKVWEGWLGVRMLNQVFGPFVLDEQFCRGGAMQMAALCHAAHVITGMISGVGAQDGLLTSVTRIEAIAQAQGRIEDVRGTLEIRSTLTRGSDRLRIAESTKTPVSQGPKLSLQWRDRFEALDRATGPVRAVEAIIEDLAGLIERYDLLMDGDDRGLVFELAPVLQSGLRNRCAELKQHPRLVAALHGVSSDSPQGLRQVQALKSLLVRAQIMDSAYEGLVEGLGRGALSVGYATDSSPQSTQGKRIGASGVPFVRPELLAAAGIVERALSSPHLAAWRHVERNHNSTRGVWKLGRLDAPKLSFSVRIELDPAGVLRLFVTHGNRSGALPGIERGTSVHARQSGLLDGSGASERLAGFLSELFSTEKADEI